MHARLHEIACTETHGQLIRWEEGIEHYYARGCVALISKAYRPFQAETYPPIQRGAPAERKLSFPILKQKRGAGVPHANAVLNGFIWRVTSSGAADKILSRGKSQV